MIYFFVHIKMNNKEFFNNKELLQKAKDRYHKGVEEKITAEYYENNKEVFGENTKIEHRSLSEEEKEVKRAYGGNRYRSMTEDEKNRLRGYQRNYKVSKSKMLVSFVQYKTE